MNKRFLVSIFFLLSAFSFELTALSQISDSLETMLHQHPENDTVRVDLLIKLGKSLVDSDNNLALEYAEKAEQISEELNFDKGRAKSLHLVGYCYQSNRDYQKALGYYQKSIEIERKLGDEFGIARHLKFIGVMHYYLGDNPTALIYFQEALAQNEKIGNKSGISASLNNIGLIHNNKGDNPRALKYYFRSLKIDEELNDKQGISICLNNIANIMRRQGNGDQALEYYEKSLQISVELEDKYGISMGLTNIATYYKEVGNYKLASEFSERAIKLYREMGDKRGIAICLNNFGEIYFNQRNYSKSLEYYIQALQTNEEIGFYQEACVIYFNIGKVYVQTHEFQKALYNTRKSLKIAQENNYLVLQKDNLLQLSQVFEATKDFENAFENFVLYKELNDSIYNEENIKEITSLENKYEHEKEKQAIELEQQKKDAVQAEEAKQQRTVRNLFIIGFVLMGLLAMVVLRSFLQKRKANHHLTEQKEEIQTQAEELQIVNNKLHELDKFKEEMTGMIVHDLKNPLNSIIGLSDNDIVRQSGKQMLNMIMNMLDVQKHEDAEIHLKTSNISISEVSKSASQQVSMLCEEKSIVLINHIQNYYVRAEREIIERVFVNILTNAIKYTPNNGTIKLESFIRSLDLIQVNIIDSGEGIPEDKLDTVFSKFEQVIAKKSGMARSTGIGLTFCKIFIEAHEGKIGVESEVGKGTSVWFTLPKGDQGVNHLKVNDNTVTEETFELAQADKELLMPFRQKFYDMEVFEYSDIEGIINEIDFNSSHNLTKWKKEMDNALYGVNQEKYLLLVGMID